MKNIFKSFIALLAAATMFTACQQEVELLGTSIEVTPAEDINFAAQQAAPVTVTVICDGDWISTSSKWIEVQPAFGTGEMTVTIIANDNVDESGAVGKPREGEVTFAATGVKAVLKVNQEGDSALLLKTLPFTEDFTEGFGDFTVNNVNVPEGKSVWTTTSYKETFYAYGSAYQLGETEAWLESPLFNLRDESTALLSFTHCYKYGDASQLTLWAKEQDGEWQQIVIPAYGSGSYDWTDVGPLDLSAYCGKIMKFGFKYTSSADSAANWEITDVKFLNVKVPEIGVKKDAVEITATTLEATFDIIAKNLEAGKNWTLTADETYDWVTKIEPASGTESAAVKVTVTENTDTENDRVASFTLKSEGLNDVKMTLTQTKGVAEDDMPKTIAELCEIITGTSSAKSNYTAKLTDAVVTYVNGKNVFIEDASGAILYYNASSTVFTAGQKINGIISGEGYAYSGLKELSSMNLDKAEVTEGAEIPLTTLTLAQLEDGYDAYISMRIKVEGITVTDGIGGDDRDGTIKQGDDEMLLRAGLKGLAAIETGAVGDMIGFPTIYISGETTKHQFGIWDAAHFTPDQSVTTFNVTPATITVDAEATSAKITVSGNAAWTATASEGATVDPASGDGAAEITVSFAANEGNEAKAYTVTVATEANVETKTFEVKINQKAAIVPAKKLPFTENFTDGFGDFKVNNVSVPSGKTVWTTASYNGSYYAKASGYGLGDGVEAWLVSPSIDLSGESAAFLSFRHCYKFGQTSQLTLWVKEEGGEWAQVTIPDYGAGNYAWADVTIDLSAYVGKTIQFAFKYVSDSVNAATWEVASISLVGNKPAVDNEITAPANLSIEKGQTAQIEASNTGNLAMTYTSSDPAVATVDANGLVTAVAAGNCKVTIATAATDEYNAATAEVAIVVTEGDEPAGDQWVLVENVADLKAGDKITFAGANETKNYAIKNYVDGGNNYGAVEVIISDKVLYEAEGMGVFVLGTAEGGYTFKGASGKYINCSSSSSKNYMKDSATISATSTFTIAIANGKATVVALTTGTTRNSMQFNYNNGSPIFNCYTAASQKPVSIYKFVAGSTSTSGQGGIDDWTEDGEDQPGQGNIEIEDWNVESEPGVTINPWTNDADPASTGTTENYGGGANLNDWIVE